MISGVNPADFASVVHLAVQFVVTGLLISAVPILAGSAIGIVYRIISKGG